MLLKDNPTSYTSTQNLSRFIVSGLRGGPHGLLLQSQLRPAQASHAISGWSPKVQLRFDHRARKSIAMGYQNEHVMIPVRFMVTVGHLLAIIMCFSFKVSPQTWHH